MRAYKRTNIVTITYRDFKSNQYRLKNNKLVGGESGILSLVVVNQTNQALSINGYTVASGAASINILQSGGESTTEFDFNLTFSIQPAESGTVVLIYSLLNL